jgi:hypothetical protein
MGHVESAIQGHNSAKMSSPNSAAITLAANRRHRGTGQPPSSPISSPPSPGEGGMRCSPCLAGAAVAAAAPPAGAALMLPGKRKAFFSSAVAVQGFAPAQGLSLVSFHPSSSLCHPHICGCCCIIASFSSASLCCH